MKAIFVAELLETFFFFGSYLTTKIVSIPITNSDLEDMHFQPNKPTDC